jgi:hypothetical protein
MPKRAGDRIKTDGRDELRLGELACRHPRDHLPAPRIDITAREAVGQEYTSNAP